MKMVSSADSRFLSIGVKERGGVEMGKNLDRASKEEINNFLCFLGSLDGGKYHEVRFLGSKKETNPSGYFNPVSYTHLTLPTTPYV